MGFRRFSVKFLILLALFVGLNALIWFGWTQKITNQHRSGGDLLRIGYILDHVAKREKIDDLPSRHMEMKDYRGGTVDIITVGDSFSVGGGSGRNSYYQDYIATLQGLTVLNVPSDIIGGGDFDSAPVITLSKLINSGYLDVIKPKYLLLESSERLAIQRLTKFFSLQSTDTIKEINSSFSKQPSEDKKPKEGIFDFHFINNGNWKFIGNNLQYRFRDKAWGSKVIISKLTRRAFSIDQGDLLIFHIDDIYNGRFSTPAGIAEANQNLNLLASALRAKNITLIFMPVVNKFNLYEPLLSRHRYPKSIFFEELRKLPKDYLLIDTKIILAQAVEKGELDIFHADDTHWSYKASQRIFSSVRLTTNSNLLQIKANKVMLQKARPNILQTKTGQTGAFTQ